MSGEDDRDIWRSVTSDVKPLTGGRKPVRVDADLKPVSPKVKRRRQWSHHFARRRNPSSWAKHPVSTNAPRNDCVVVSFQ